MRSEIHTNCGINLEKGYWKVENSSELWKEVRVLEVLVCECMAKYSHLWRHWESLQKVLLSSAENYIKKYPPQAYGVMTSVHSETCMHFTYWKSKLTKLVWSFIYFFKTAGNCSALCRKSYCDTVSLTLALKAIKIWLLSFEYNKVHALGIDLMLFPYWKSCNEKLLIKSPLRKPVFFSS